MNNKEIIHITSVHDRYDTRIFKKQCLSLSDNGYDVTLVVADGKCNEIIDKIKIIDLGKPSNRLSRIFLKTIQILLYVLKSNGKIIHIHDPELIFVGLFLKVLNKKVIYDSHEDFPKQILSKPYLNKYIRVLISNIATIFERIICKNFNYIVAATPHIENKFKLINLNTITINNYPILNELYLSETSWSNKNNTIVFVGAISKIRGIKEVVKSLSLTTNDVIFKIGGNFHDGLFKEKCKSENGWSFVRELGFVDRNMCKKLFDESVAGIVTFLPEPNHIESQPNKMFEYMSAGLPVIASNFPLWKEIIEGNNCGICVDPLSPSSISNAIDYIIDNPDISEKMGKNGYYAITEKYNWKIEELKLIKIYQELFK